MTSPRPYLLTACCLALAVVALPGEALADAKVATGTVRSVDAETGRLTIVQSGTGERLTFTLSEGTKIQEGRNQLDSSALTPGLRVSVFYDSASRKASKVRITPAGATVPPAEAAPAPAPPPAAQGSAATGTSLSERPAAPAPLPPGNEAYALAVAPSKRFHAVMTYDIQAPKLTATEWIIYVPKPPQLPGQPMVDTSVSPQAEATDEAGPLKRALLLARLKADDESLAHGIKLQVDYDAQLASRRLVQRERGVKYPKTAELSEEERERHLGASSWMDFDSQDFQAWLDQHDLRRRSKEGEIDFARRAFLAIKGDFSYAFPPPTDRKASLTCGARQSDCGGLAVVFCSALRANHIPARMLVGRWAKSAVPGEQLGGMEYGQWHVKAEFHAGGVGWVPADLSSAVLHDHTSEGLRYFGNDSGDFLTMHLDADLVFDTIHFGQQTVPWVQGIAFWVSGSGTLDGQVTREDWQVR